MATKVSLSDETMYCQFNKVYPTEMMYTCLQDLHALWMCDDHLMSIHANSLRHT
jgi:hypothetical protein